MKVILQAFEPQPRPFGRSDAELRPVATPPVRKARVRLQPVLAESRLFHAL